MAGREPARVLGGAALMALPYSSTTAGRSALVEIEKLLREFGCARFGAMNDYSTGELIIQFEHRGRMVEVRASSKGYAAAWLRENEWNSRRRGTKKQHEDRALEIGQTAVYSIARDWIKGQLMAIETGMLSFEGAFLGHLMLPDGRRVIEVAEQKGLLPAPGEA